MTTLRQRECKQKSQVRHLPLDAPDPASVLALVGAPEGAEVVAYCHSGSRSALAVSVLASAGYAARNYVGSWHAWSRDPDLPAATGPTD